MTTDEGEKLWKTQPVGLEMTVPRSEAISRESSAFSRAVWYRDIREWATTLILFVVFFGAGLFPGAPRVWFVSAASPESEYVRKSGNWMVFSPEFEDNRS